LEREYKLAEKLGKEAGPGQKYFIKTVDFLRLPARRHGDPPLVAMVSEAPGRNYLIDMVGPSLALIMLYPSGTDERRTG